MSICTKLDTLYTGPTRRWVALVAGIIELFWFSGVHYGFNALLPVYIAKGVFGSYCVGGDCTQQDLMFSYAFIVSVVGQMCLIPLAGLLMDRVGLRLNKMVTVVILAIGIIMFGFLNATTGPMIFVAMVLVSYASLSSLLCNHQISSQFPNTRGLIIATLSGAYDSSSAVFFIISITYPGISIETSFIVLALGTLVYGMVMATFLLTRYSSDMTYCDGRIEKEDAVVKKVSDDKLEEIYENDLDGRIGTIVSSKYPSLKSCVLSMPFFLACFWFALGLLRFSYFLSQLSGQLQIAFNGDVAIINQLLQISSATSMCGFLVAPISGVIMDFSRKGFHKQLKKRLQSSGEKLTDGEIYWTHLRSLAPATLLMATASLILSCILFVNGNQGVYYLAFIVTMFLRSLLFSTGATMVITAFPLNRYGTVFGFVNLIAGICSTLQYGLLELPAIAGNSICVAVSVLLFFPPLFLFLKKH